MYADWDAWYTGDPDRLRAVYEGRGYTTQDLPPSQRRYPGQTAGGVIGRFSRWLWGAPPTPNQRDGRLHIPLPADLAAVSANLLFSEPPKLTHEAPAVMERLEQLVDDGLHDTLLHAAEAASVLGDVYLRPVVDLDVSPRAIIATAHADGAVPVIRWGRLVEVTFWSELERDGQKVVRLLEHHEVGRITYAVHEGTITDLGRRVDLAAYAPDLADLVDADGSQATGLDRLDVVRVPNAGPQRAWRRQGALKYHGRSDFDSNETMFDSLDECWTSWMRDLRLARARIMIPDWMLQSQGPGKGAVADLDQEVYQAINTAPGQGDGITLSQFAIRVADHQATAEAITKAILRHAGISPQTLGDQGGDVAVTATEVQARERRSFGTRGTRIQAWRPAIADLIELILAVEILSMGATVEPVKPSVEFGDSVSESPETTARTLQLLDAAAAISTETKVRMVHPDWDDQQVTAEVQRITAATQVPQDPGTFTGEPDPAPEDEPAPEEA